MVILNSNHCGERRIRNHFPYFLSSPRFIRTRASCTLFSKSDALSWEIYQNWKQEERKRNKAHRRTLGIVSIYTLTYSSVTKRGHFTRFYLAQDVFTQNRVQRGEWKSTYVGFIPFAPWKYRPSTISLRVRAPIFCNQGMINVAKG